MMKIKYSGLLVAMLLPLTYVNAEEVSLTPPNAKPGECYARVIIPAEYDTVEEKVMIKEASEEISIVPAEYETMQEEVEVIPATKKLTPVPATFKELSEEIETKAKIVTWKTSLEENAPPVSDAILGVVSASGVDLNSSAVGDCYKEYFVARKFKKFTEEFLIKSEYNETEVIAPEFEVVEKTIVTKAATKKIVEVPAVYEEIEEQVLVEAEKTVWKKGQNPAQNVSGATGEIMCLVNIPAKYKTIKKRVLKEPATTKIVEIPEETEVIAIQKLITDTQIKYIPVPAVYETIEKTELESSAKFSWHDAKDKMKAKYKYTGHQVCLTEEPAETKVITKAILDTPVSIEEEVVPPTNKMVDVQELVAEAKEIRTPIEAEYKMVSKQVKISDTHVGWKRILCETNMNNNVISEIQTALNAKGYDAGEADGVMGNGTKAALAKFQKDSNLATGGVTYETLDALGISTSTKATN